MNEKIKDLSDLIAVKSANEAQCFPIDRYFLEQYLNDIFKLDKQDFLLYNFEKVNVNYTVHLMLCLPELWEDITLDEIIHLMRRFTNTFSFYAMINFTYRYIEIDILGLILHLECLNDSFIFQIKEYLKNQYRNLLKTESDYLFFEERLWGIDNSSWMYIKQKFLLDERVAPALQSLNELHKHIVSLVI
jgi:hypothetical protein